MSLAPEAQVQLVTQLGIIAVLVVTYFLNKRKANEVAAKVAVVADTVTETTAATVEKVAKLQVTADATHQIVNSRYDEIKNELRKSNERVEALLAQIRSGAPSKPVGGETGQQSDIIAAAEQLKKKGK